jgi:hypothetical protein
MPGKRTVCSGKRGRSLIDGPPTSLRADISTFKIAA